MAKGTLIMTQSHINRINSSTHEMSMLTEVKWL